MLEAEIPPELAHDPWGKNVPGLGRDGCRTPMQWTPTGGFSDNPQTWLPTGPEVEHRNVASELKDPGSMLSLYRRLLEYRRHSPTLQLGDYETVPQSDARVLAFRRRLGGETLMVAASFSDSEIPAEVEGFEGRRLVLSTDPTRRSVGEILLLGPHEAVLMEVT